MFQLFEVLVSFTESSFITVHKSDCVNTFSNDRNIDIGLKLKNLSY